jgi:hypothetical protein
MCDLMGMHRPGTPHPGNELVMQRAHIEIGDSGPEAIRDSRLDLRRGRTQPPRRGWELR